MGGAREARKTGGRLRKRQVAALAFSWLWTSPPTTVEFLLGTTAAAAAFSLFFPLALLAALRGGRARVHEKEDSNLNIRVTWSKVS